MQTKGLSPRKFLKLMRILNETQAETQRHNTQVSSLKKEKKKNETTHLPI